MQPAPGKTEGSSSTHEGGEREKQQQQQQQQQQAEGKVRMPNGLYGTGEGWGAVY